jgi:hypothetical protein
MYHVKRIAACDIFDLNSPILDIFETEIDGTDCQLDFAGTGTRLFIPRAKNWPELF